MINLRVIAGFFKKEIPQTLRDRKMAAIIFILPVFQLVLFGFALTTEVKNISVYAAYEPDDFLMRAVEERFVASKWFVKAENLTDADYVRAITRKKAEVVIVSPPEGLAVAIERGKADIQLLIDATNAQRAVQIENYVKNIFDETMKEYYKSDVVSPVKVDVKVLYNPAMESSYFMIPAIMGFALCILTVLIAGMSMAKEKEMGTLEKLISSPVSVIEILLGKTLPYVMLSLIVVPLMVFTGIILFDIPVAGGIMKIFLVCFVFIISSCSASIFISTLAKTQQQSMMGSLMFLIPSLLMSGVMFPVENIPVAVRWIAHINPLYYLSMLLRNIMLKGGDWHFLLQNCTALLIIGSVLAVVSVKQFRSKLN